MSYVSVCKNTIAANNKRGWKNPEPAIRVSKTPSGKVVARAHEIEIFDKDGNVVAVLVSSTDGKPVIKCGAKVALITKYGVGVGDHGTSLRRQAVADSAT
jgi:hypothetical protein